MPLQRFDKIACKKIMPPWTLEELEAARPEVLPEITSNELANRFQIWGGNMRNCLSEVSQMDDIRNGARLKQLIQLADLDMVISSLTSAQSLPMRWFSRVVPSSIVSTFSQ